MVKKQRYISNELTHFVGRKLSDKESQYKALIKILKEGLLANNPSYLSIHGNLRVSPHLKLSSNEMFNPEVICFCDIPVEDLDLHIKKYSGFGLSFLKPFLIQHGANPVFYIANNSKVIVFKNFADEEVRKEVFKDGKEIDEKNMFDKISRGQYFDKNVKEWVNNSLFNRSISTCLKHFLDFHILSFIKCFEVGKDDDDMENYYMEREWRLIGNLEFKLEDVHRIIIPKSYSKRFREDLPDYVGQINFGED